MRNAVVVGILTAALSGFASPAAQAGPEEDKLAGDLLALVNKERVAAGCPELTVNPLLTDAARRHSQDLANHNGKSSHTGFDGSDPEARIRATGYEPNGWAENVYANAPDASTAMYGQSGGYGWFNEPPDEKGKRGHHDNILTCIYTETGIGIARAATAGSIGPRTSRDLNRPRPLPTRRRTWCRAATLMPSVDHCEGHGEHGDDLRLHDQGAVGR
jgi:uncharacterized protein YkwD